MLWLLMRCLIDIKFLLIIIWIWENQFTYLVFQFAAECWLMGPSGGVDSSYDPIETVICKEALALRTWLQDLVSWWEGPWLAGRRPHEASTHFSSSRYVPYSSTGGSCPCSSLRGRGCWWALRQEEASLFIVCLHSSIIEGGSSRFYLTGTN